MFRDINVEKDSFASADDPVTLNRCSETTIVREYP